MIEMRLRPRVDLITLRVSERLSVEQDEFHLHAGLINVRPEQLCLLDGITPPDDHLGCLQPDLELRQIALSNRLECVWRAHGIHPLQCENHSRCVRGKWEGGPRKYGDRSM